MTFQRRGTGFFLLRNPVTNQIEHCKQFFAETLFGT